MRRRILAALLVALGIIILATIATKTVFKPADQSVSDRFVKYALKGDASDSYQLFGESAAQQTSAEDWANSTAQLSAFFAGAKPAFEKKVASNGHEVFTYLIDGYDGTYEFVVTLNKDGSSYKVWSFASNLKYSKSDTTSTKNE